MHQRTKQKQNKNQKTDGSAAVKTGAVAALACKEAISFGSRSDRDGHYFVAAQVSYSTCRFHDVLASFWRSVTKHGAVGDGCHPSVHYVKRLTLLTEDGSQRTMIFPNKIITFLLHTMRYTPFPNLHVLSGNM